MGALAVTLGCGGGGGSTIDVGKQLTELSTGPSEVRLVHGMVRTLRGRFPTDGATPSARARSFVAAAPGAFGLDDIDTELGEGVETVDGTHASVTFTRKMAGLVVDGASIRIHLEGSDVVLVTAQLPADRRLVEADPTLSEAEAIAIVAAEFNATSLARAPSVALVAYDPGLAELAAGTEVTQAWRIIATSPSGSRTVAYVDAGDGSLLSLVDASQTAQSRIVGRYDAGQASACVVQPCPAFDVATVAHQVVYAEDGAQVAEPTTDETAVFDAMADVYSYWSSTFGRDSYDDRGAELLAFVGHPAAPSDGFGGEQHPAVWKGSIGALFLRASFVAPDIVAHELGHALIGSIDNHVLVKNRCTESEKSAAESSGSDECERQGWPLRGAAGGQPGALSEGVPDVLSVFAQQAAGAPATDWQVADKLGVVRDLSGSRDLRDYDPAKSNHANGLIFGSVMKLLVDGRVGPVPDDPEVVGIGRAQAEQILYRALRLYFAPLTDFEDARWKMLRACEDFISRGNEFGIDYRECGSVLNAFAAVGIGERDSDRDTWIDSNDVCPDVYDPEQVDTDGDGEGDECSGIVMTTDDPPADGFRQYSGTGTISRTLTLLDTGESVECGGDVTWLVTIDEDDTMQLSGAFEVFPELGSPPSCGTGQGRIGLDGTIDDAAGTFTLELRCPIDTAPGVQCEGGAPTSMGSIDASSFSGGYDETWSDPTAFFPTQVQEVITFDLSPA